MTNIGFLSSWNIVPNPRIFDLNDYEFWFDVAPSVSKPDLIEKLRLMPGVIIVISSYGSMLGVMIRYNHAESLNREIRLIRELSKASNIHTAYIQWPECTIRFSRIDYEILSALATDPRKTYQSLSAHLRVSARTIRRRIARLTKNHLVFELCAIDPKGLEGTVLADLYVRYHPRDGGRINLELEKLLNHQFIHLHRAVSAQDETHYSWFVLALPNVPKAHELVGQVHAVPGVREARVELKEEHHIYFDTMHEPIHQSLIQSRQPHS